MPLIKNGRIAADLWVVYPDAAPLQPDIPAVVSLARFLAERAALIASALDLGVRLAPGEQSEALARDLDRLRLIQIEFPSFTDGRGYSAARLLRERHRYRGELRAVGQVLRDQYLFLARAGFDAFETPEGETPAAWRAAVGAVGPAYQPAADDRRPVWARRCARRAAAAE
jgi:uncharacterized protein (DUF934 family)